MFNRPARTGSGPRGFEAVASSDAGRRLSQVASLITDAITIEGNVSGDGELQVDCVIRGDVSVSRLSIGETGVIEGAVKADTVEVRGTVAGSITARQIRLHATARVDGDVTHDQLTMDSGARFEGRSLRLSQAPPEE
jgi:cytoskeletal protein CcmA (bactofilin family)